MMLSPQAARMGTVSTTLRQIGKQYHHPHFRRCRSLLYSRRQNTIGKQQQQQQQQRQHLVLSFNNNNKTSSASLSTIFFRLLSTATKSDYCEIDELENEFDPSTYPSTTKINRNGGTQPMGPPVVQQPHTAVTAVVSDDIDQSSNWKVNLGRGTDNEWLMSPRNSEEWFTGISPGSKDCPGVDECTGVIRSLPLPNLTKVTRQTVQEYFDNSWSLYETLFAGLKGEEPFYRPPVHGLRHPQIFYYGHTACLYINKLRCANIIHEPVNAYYESIFEVGVDEMLWDDMNKNEMIWPKVSDVHAYRQQVYKVVKDVIQNHPLLDDRNGPLTIHQNHPMWALFMGFEHERIHFETSSVLFRETPLHFVQTPLNWPPLHPSAYERITIENNKNKNNNNHDNIVTLKTTNPLVDIDYPPNRMIPVPEPHTVDLGKPASFPSYGWDNEYGERSVIVPPFTASEHMITNGEYWQFVQDAGYRTEEYWCEDGWSWRTHRNMKWPFFWDQAGPAGSNEFHLRTIFQRIPMMWDWPVDVNYYEAKAYCRWYTSKQQQQQDITDSEATTGNDDNNKKTISKKIPQYRLLTEAEHHVLRPKAHNITAARNDYDADPVMVTSGHQFAGSRIFPGTTTTNDNTNATIATTGTANLNLAYSSQNPVTYYPPSETGHRDPTGNAWEWTEDHFNPLKGFEVHHIYDDFSTPCFDGKHSMIVGGSFMSTGDEASVFARFHFRPHFLQHSGFRLVSSDHPTPVTHLFNGERFGNQASASPSSSSFSTTITSSTDTASQIILPTSSSGQGSPVTNVYETDDSLHMYLGLHYESSGINEGVPSILPHNNAPSHALRFPQRVAQLLTTTLRPDRTDRALDIGCAVGGASFELARTFHTVDAFDFSSSFVLSAQKMQTNPEDVTFRIPIEGDLFTTVQAVHDSGITTEIRNKVNFFTGDACDIPTMVHGRKQLLESGYDGIMMSNLLCRLPDPIACLDGLSLLVRPGGVVVMVTPFSWLTEFTPRSKWLGGFNDSVTGQVIHSHEQLHQYMSARGFEQIHEEEIPVLIREHQRKFQYIISLATGWRKK